MNQILVTEKIYVTPELRRRRKLFKIEFFLCVFLVCMLFTYYIYAEYDRERSEEVSQEILMGLSKEKASEKIQNKEQKKVVDTTIKKSDNIIIVVLEDNEEHEAPKVTPQIVEDQVTGTRTVEYETEDGVNYIVESIIRIPCLDLNYPVIADTSEELLKISLNKYWGPGPNEVGNYCVVGHNYKSKKMFGRLSEIENGDIIEVEDMNGKVVQYSVYDRYAVDPEDTDCTSQLTGGRKEITLITCTNYGTQRLVVKATEVK